MSRWANDRFTWRGDKGGAFKWTQAPPRQPLVRNLGRKSPTATSTAPIRDISIASTPVRDFGNHAQILTTSALCAHRSADRVGVGERVSVGDHIGLGPRDRVRKTAGGRQGERPMGFFAPGNDSDRHGPPTGRLAIRGGRPGASGHPRDRPYLLYGKAASVRHDDGCRADEKGRPGADLRAIWGGGALAMAEVPVEEGRARGFLLSV